MTSVAKPLSMANFHAVRYFVIVCGDLRPLILCPASSLAEIAEVRFLGFPRPSYVNAHTRAARFHSEAVINSPKPLVLTRPVNVVQVVGVRGLGEPRRQQRGDDEHRL